MFVRKALSLLFVLNGLCLAQAAKATPDMGDETVSEYAFPDLFVDARAARRAGCRMMRLKPDVRSCLLARPAEFTRHLMVNLYDEQPDGQWRADQKWRIQSWYGKATARLLPFQPRQPLLALTFEANHGVGLLQMVDLWVAWDAQTGKYRPVLLESVSYHWQDFGRVYDWRADLKLVPGRPGERAPYIKMTGHFEQSIASEHQDIRNHMRYRERLAWDAANFSFYDAAREGRERDRSGNIGFWLLRSHLANIRSAFLRDRPTPEQLGENILDVLPEVSSFIEDE